MLVGPFVTAQATTLSSRPRYSAAAPRRAGSSRSAIACLTLESWKSANHGSTARDSWPTYRLLATRPNRVSWTDTVRIFVFISLSPLQFGRARKRALFAQAFLITPGSDLLHCRAVVGAASTCLNVYPSTLFHGFNFVHVNKHKKSGGAGSPPAPPLLTHLTRGGFRQSRSRPHLRPHGYAACSRNRRCPGAYQQR